MIVKTQTNISITTNWQDDFRQHLVGSGRSERTVQAYSRDISLFTAWFESENGQAFTTALVTSFDLRGWRAHSLDAERVSAATWNRRRISLRVFTSWLVETGLLEYSPFKGVEPVQQDEKAVRALDRASRNRFLRQLEINLNGARSPFARRSALRSQALVALMLYAGLREGEAVRLDVDDVQINPRSGQVLVRRGKGDKSRTVPLGREARQALQSWLDEIGDNAGALFANPGGGALFANPSGGRLSTRQVQRIVSEIGRQAGLVISPHDLRHTFASHLVHERQAALPTVQKLLGHARIDQTARYAKPTWQNLQDAVEAL
jgi:integrase/recombinase XerC